MYLYTIQKDEDRNLSYRSYSMYSLVTERQKWCFNDLPHVETITGGQTPTVLWQITEQITKKFKGQSKWSGATKD